MEENRKLVFNDEVKRREEARVKRFKVITIFITLIICIFIIPLYEVWNYNQARIKSQPYINIAEEIWYNGIEDISYTTLKINILDDSIKYEDIYNQGISYIGYNKLTVRICIDNNFWIMQKKNTIRIKDNRNGNITTLKFNEDGVKVINKSKVSCILSVIFLIILFIGLATTIILLYMTDEEKRMTKDMNRLSNSDDSIF